MTAFNARSVIVWLGFIAPVAAHAQFSIVSQNASVSAGATLSERVSQVSTPGDLSSLALHVQSTDPAGVAGGSAGASTIAESGRVGISAGSGGWSSSTFYCPNGNDGFCGYPSGSGSAQVSQYFDVLRPADVSVLLENSYVLQNNDYYRYTDHYQAGSLWFPLGFQKLSEGNWVAMDSPAALTVLQSSPIKTQVSGQLHLDEGHYRLQSNMSGSVGITGFNGGGTSITITAAVPEPASLSMMALGVLALGAVARRHGRSKA